MTGSGTVGDPFVIYDVNDLQDIELDLFAYYELANDIDASATIGWHAGAGFVPISWFRGHFDGKDYTISGLFINRPATSWIGLFGYAANATIQNVTLADVDMTGRDYVGGLAGDSNTSIISGAVSGGAVAGRFFIGGLIGYSFRDTITDCAAAGTAVGTTYVGGLLGYFTTGSCSSSHAATAVTGGNYSGGLVGWMEVSDISESYATGNITPNVGAVGVGGFVGYTRTSGTIDRCFATGNVVCDATAIENGAFVGQLNDVAISNCYATGAITSSWGGGFAGTNDGSIDKCYAIGAITDLGNCGGLVALGGWIAATASFWDTQTTGLIVSDSGTGRTTAEMKSKVTFTTAGWDFTTIWNICPGINSNYPCLVGLTPSCRYVSKHHIPTHPTEPNRGKVLSRMGSL